MTITCNICSDRAKGSFVILAERAGFIPVEQHGLQASPKESFFEAAGIASGSDVREIEDAITRILSRPHPQLSNALELEYGRTLSHLVGSLNHPSHPASYPDLSWIIALALVTNRPIYVYCDRLGFGQVREGRPILGVLPPGNVSRHTQQNAVYLLVAISNIWHAAIFRGDEINIDVARIITTSLRPLIRGEQQESILRRATPIIENNEEFDEFVEVLPETEEDEEQEGPLLIKQAESTHIPKIFLEEITNSTRFWKVNERGGVMPKPDAYLPREKLDWVGSSERFRQLSRFNGTWNKSIDVDSLFGIISMNLLDKAIKGNLEALGVGTLASKRDLESVERFLKLNHEFIGFPLQGIKFARVLSSKSHSAELFLIFPKGEAKVQATIENGIEYALGFHCTSTRAQQKGHTEECAAFNLSTHTAVQSPGNRKLAYKRNRQMVSTFSSKLLSCFIFHYQDKISCTTEEEILINPMIYIKWVNTKMTLRVMELINITDIDDEIRKVIVPEAFGEYLWLDVSRQAISEPLTIATTSVWRRSAVPLVSLGCPIQEYNQFLSDEIVNAHGYNGRGAREFIIKANIYHGLPDILCGPGENPVSFMNAASEILTGILDGKGTITEITHKKIGEIERMAKELNEKIEASKGKSTCVRAEYRIPYTNWTTAASLIELLFDDGFLTVNTLTFPTELLLEYLRKSNYIYLTGIYNSLLQILSGEGTSISLRSGICTISVMESLINTLWTGRTYSYCRELMWSGERNKSLRVQESISKYGRPSFNNEAWSTENWILILLPDEELEEYLDRTLDRIKRGSKTTGEIKRAIDMINQISKITQYENIEERATVIVDLYGIEMAKEAGIEDEEDSDAALRAVVLKQKNGITVLEMEKPIKEMVEKIFDERKLEYKGFNRPYLFGLRESLIGQRRETIQEAIIEEMKRRRVTALHYVGKGRNFFARGKTFVKVSYRKEEEEEMGLLGRIVIRKRRRNSQEEEGEEEGEEEESEGKDQVGRSRNKRWTEEETFALLEGIQKYGHGCWMEIYKNRKSLGLNCKRTRQSYSDRARTLERADVIRVRKRGEAVEVNNNELEKFLDRTVRKVEDIVENPRSSAEYCNAVVLIQNQTIRTEIAEEAEVILRIEKENEEDEMTERRKNEEDEMTERRKNEEDETIERGNKEEEMTERGNNEGEERWHTTTEPRTMERISAQTQDGIWERVIEEARRRLGEIGMIAMTRNMTILRNEADKTSWSSIHHKLNIKLRREITTQRWSELGQALADMGLLEIRTLYPRIYKLRGVRRI